MKINSQQIQQFMPEIGKNIFSVLLHGVDYGVKIDIVNMICSKFLGAEFAKNIINLDFSSPEEASKIMFSELMNYDLIPVKKVIKIKSASNKLTPSIQNIVNKINDINKDVLIVIIAEDLDTKSSLRILYETNGALCSIGCYADTIEDSIKIANSFLSANGVNFDQNVPKFIASCFTGDRMALKNELLKIVLFLDKNEQLTTDICQMIIDDSLAYTPDVFLDSIGVGDLKTAITELDRAIFEGNNSVGIIRFSVFHFLKLKEMLVNISSGSNIESEITKNRIFFKRVPNYRKQLTKLTIKKVNIILSKLLKVETKIKQYNEDVGISMLKFELNNL